MMTEYTDEELNARIRDIAGSFYERDDPAKSPVMRFLDSYEWADITFDCSRRKYNFGAILGYHDELVWHAEDLDRTYPIYRCNPEETAQIRAKLVELVDNPTIHNIRQYHDWLQSTFAGQFNPAEIEYQKRRPRGMVSKWIDGEFRTNISGEWLTREELTERDNALRRELGLKVYE